MSDVTNYMLGSQQVSEVYCGPTKIWPKIPNVYFYIDTAHNTFGVDDNLYAEVLCTEYDGNTHYPQTLYYSYDQTNWNTANIDSYVTYTYNISGWTYIYERAVVRIPISSYNRVYLKGNLTPVTTSTNSYASPSQVEFNRGIIYKMFSEYVSPVDSVHYANNISVGGNICSLIYGDIAHDTIPSGYSYVFSELFGDGYIPTSSSVQDISNVILPNNVTEGCYMRLFANMPSITYAPALRASTLAPKCYWQMFGGCSSLTFAPLLRASVLEADCYRGMFYDCSLLQSVICLATDISAARCTFDWLYDVAQNGKFVKAASTSWTTGTSGIPSDWTCVDAS